jgi:hypothetical protein
MEIIQQSGEKLRIQLGEASNSNEDDKDFAMGDTNQDLVNDLYECSGIAKTPGARPKKKNKHKQSVVSSPRSLNKVKSPGNR